MQTVVYTNLGIIQGPIYYKKPSKKLKGGSRKGGERLLKKISFWYTLMFILLWNGYALQQYMTGQPGSLQLFLFGAAFTVVLLGLTWFARWLLDRYKVIDKKAKENLFTKVKNKE